MHTHSSNNAQATQGTHLDITTTRRPWHRPHRATSAVSSITSLMAMRTCILFTTRRKFKLVDGRPSGICATLGLCHRQTHVRACQLFPRFELCQAMMLPSFVTTSKWIHLLSRHWPLLAALELVLEGAKKRAPCVCNQ